MADRRDPHSERERRKAEEAKKSKAQQVVKESQKDSRDPRSKDPSSKLKSDSDTAVKLQATDPKQNSYELTSRSARASSARRSKHRYPAGDRRQDRSSSEESDEEPDEELDEESDEELVLRPDRTRQVLPHRQIRREAPVVHGNDGDRHKTDARSKDAELNPRRRADSTIERANPRDIRVPTQNRTDYPPLARSYNTTEQDAKPQLRRSATSSGPAPLTQRDLPGYSDELPRSNRTNTVDAPVREAILRSRDPAPSTVPEPYQQRGPRGPSGNLPTVRNIDPGVRAITPQDTTLPARRITQSTAPAQSQERPPRGSSGNLPTSSNDEPLARTAIRQEAIFQPRYPTQPSDYSSSSSQNRAVQGFSRNLPIHSNNAPGIGTAVRQEAIFPPRQVAQPIGPGTTQERHPRGSSDNIGNSSNQGPDATSSAEHHFNNFPFTVLTDPICQSFVKIPQHEIGERLEFLSHNMHLFKGPHSPQIQTLLLRQAVEFSKMGKEYASLSCSLSLALIQVAKNQHVETVDRFFEALMQSSSRENKNLRETFTKVRDIVATTANSQGQTPRGSLGNIPGPPNAPSGSGSAQALQGLGNPRELAAPDDDEATLTVFFGQELETDQKIRPDNTGDPSKSRNPDINRLHPAYQLRNGKSWFMPGRVFAILWHESAGNNKKKKKKVTDELSEPLEGDKMKPGLDPAYSRALYDSTVYSHIRRFVVVRNRHGYCWCVAIGTYGGRGLAKPGLSDEDINAHTVVYDAARAPAYFRNEPRSNKRPIGIQMANNATLDPASRLHLGKPYNVEWNVKVMDVGNVVPADLEALKAYVREELFD